MSDSAGARPPLLDVLGHLDVLGLPVVGLHRAVQLVCPAVAQRQQVERHRLPTADYALGRERRLGLVLIEDESPVSERVGLLHPSSSEPGGGRRPRGRLIGAADWVVLPPRTANDGRSGDRARPPRAGRAWGLTVAGQRRNEWPPDFADLPVPRYSGERGNVRLPRTDRPGPLAPGLAPHRPTSLGPVHRWLETERAARVCACLGALAIAWSSILVKLSHSSPSTAAIFRCAYAAPVLLLLALFEDRAMARAPGAIAARRSSLVSSWRPI